MNLETIPCAYKERVESRVVDELCMISEEYWTSHGKYTKRKVVSQESREDLSSLLYKMLVIEDENTCFPTSKTPLAAWQVCVSPKQHKGGYLLDPPSLDALGTNKAAVFRKDPQFFTPARCCDVKEDKTELNTCTCAERDSGTKDVKSKSSSFALEQSTINNNNIQDDRRLERNTDSPYTEFKFYHHDSIYSDVYIKSYREQITNLNIKRHVQWRLRENSINTVKKPTTKTHVVKSKTVPKPSFSFAFYRFCISKKESTCNNSVLKVGPCPRNLPGQNHSKRSRYSGIKTQSNSASTATKKMDQRKETKFVVTNLGFQTSRPHARTENIVTIPGPDSDEKYNGTAPKTKSNEGKLKKVQLKVVDCSTESPRIVPKAVRANKLKSKTRTLGVCLKPSTQCNRSYSEISYERKVTRKAAFEEREFLRITTPKPITHCQQLRKTSSELGESPGFSPDKSIEVSPMRSPVPSVSGTSVRSQLQEILMKREPQLVFPKHSNFQACITPSNYSNSSVESHVRCRKDGTPDGLEQDLDEEKNYNVKRMLSKPSIPRIGPFISS